MASIIKRSTRPNGSLRIQTMNSEPSKTQQQFAADADINNIMKRYRNTGELPSATIRKGVYADVSGLTDYHSMVTLISTAQSQFQELPAHIRTRFRNDPGELVRFLNDPNNRQEAIELQLLDKPKNDDGVKGEIKTPKKPSVKKSAVEEQVEMPTGEQ